MKATCLLILAIGCAALARGTSYAAPSQQASAESSANTASGRSNDDHSHDSERAAPADDGKRQKEGTPVRQAYQPRDRRHASAKNHPRSRASLAAANRPKQLPNSRKRSLPGDAMNLHQPRSDKSGGAAKGGLIQNERVNNALPVRPTSVARPTVASLNNALNPSLNSVRHRGPNSAVVGGPANSTSSNTGAIDGSRMNRRP